MEGESKKKNSSDSIPASFENQLVNIVVDAAKDAIIVMDNQSKVVLWNKAAEKMLKYKEAEVKGKEFHSLIGVKKEHREKKDQLKRFGQTGQSPVLDKTVELQVKSKMGEVINVELSISSAKIGADWFAIGIMHDITRRKANEQKNEQLSTIIESTSDFVAVANIAGQVIYVNHAGRKMMGYGVNEDLLKIKIIDHYPEEERDKILNTALLMAQKVGIWQGETTFVSRAGVRIPVSEVIIYKKNANENDSFYATIVRDITKEKQKIDEVEKLNKIMIGRELRMIELKKEIEKLKEVNISWENNDNTN